MKITVKVPGSCGELVQGFYRGEPVLITCPIEKFSSVTISDEFKGIENLGEKSRTMLEKVLNFFGEKFFCAGVRLTSELPEGKGMSSSSADLAAVAKAVALFLDKKISAAEIGKIAAEIEPTDGVFFEGVVAMNPLKGNLLKKIVLPEKYFVAVFDYGGKIDTVKFNRRSNFQISDLNTEINFELIKKSALENQKILPKRGIEEIIEFSQKLGAITVNVAHSGTVIGIFFSENDTNINFKIRELQKSFHFVKYICLTKICDGGFYISRECGKNLSQ